MPGAKPESELEGRVRDLTHAGDAVVETARGIVLAHGALPGERVRVRLGRKVAGAQRGVVIALLEPSPERVAAACPLFDRCGGCPLMGLSEGAERRFKHDKLRALCAELAPEVEPELVAAPSRSGYRARARLSWRREGRDARLGYFAPSSHTLVDVSSCLVLDAALGEGLRELRESLLPELQGEGEIALGVGRNGRCVADLKSAAAQPQAAYAAAERTVARGGLAGLALRVDGGAPATFGDPSQLAHCSDGEPALVPPGGFTQANPQVNAALVARVLELAQPRDAHVLELYAGYGNLSVGLAREAASLRAVEIDRAAASACQENLRLRGLTKARVVNADAAEGAAAKGGTDVVVLDPPRAGAREVLPALVARRPKRIVYVSCNLATLRRDLRQLAEAGYRVDAVTGFDMFPCTGHLETVVRLQR